MSFYCNFFCLDNLRTLFPLLDFFSFKLESCKSGNPLQSDWTLAGPLQPAYQIRPIDRFGLGVSAYLW